MKLLEIWFLQWLPTLLSFISSTFATDALRNDHYSASFQVPTIQLNKTALVAYQVNLTVPDLKSPLPTSTILSIALCQSAKKPVTENNSWNVLNIINNLCFGSPSSGETCKNNPYKGRGGFLLNLTQDDAFNSTGDDTLKNFFFCISNTNTSLSTVCDYSSSLFDIYPSVPGSKPVDPDTLTSTPEFFPTPTHLALIVTSTRSTVLQTQVLITSSIPVIPTVKKQKYIPKVTIICIAFGILALLLLIGLITLFFIRRSGDRKNALDKELLNIDPLSKSTPTPKTVGDNMKSATSPTWEYNRSNSVYHKKSPSQDLNSSEYRPVTGPGRNSIVSQLTTNSKGSTLEAVSHLSRSKNNNHRDTEGNMSIIPIASIQSQSLYDYRDRHEYETSMPYGVSSASPFLREEGMSPEDIARLEDEERRIDAAIAAAEAERLKNRR